MFKFFHDLIAERRGVRARAQQLAHQQSMQQTELDHQTTTQQRDLAHHLALQREERAHQAEVRREADFYEARRAYLPGVVAVHDWIQWWWGDLHGAEVDYHPVTQNQPKLVRSPGDAMTVLAELAGNHPSKSIRDFARQLLDSIDSTVNFPDPSGYRDPTVDELANWSKRAGELIDALHDPKHHLAPN
ncbi:hypothetical protein [Ornithinimicrobium panacihumi]|uniref:hypothetical protein n=1 Tax=Ornithinimicrobium panacihumi TaxID=2008449 RepID=UPI003F8CB9BB